MNPRPGRMWCRIPRGSHCQLCNSLCRGGWDGCYCCLTPGTHWLEEHV